MFDWIAGVLEKGGYFGLLFLTFIENVFPPIPSELIMPFGGFLARDGKMHFLLAWLTGTIGSTLGSLPLYYVGLKFGAKRVRGFCEDYGFWAGVDGKDFDKAKSWFDKHQSASVFFCRIIPGIRGFIAVPAGVAKMPLPQFLIYTFAGCAVWCLFLVTLGWVLGPSFQSIDRFLGPVSKVIVGAVVLYFVYRAVTKWKAKKGKKSAKATA